MPVFVGLLRAVNVGGTGKLPMRDLVALCEAIGFLSVRTYIASGNLVFSTGLSEPEARAALEARLLAHAGRPIGVHLRKAAALDTVLSGNPFTQTRPEQTVVIFLDAPPPADLPARATGRQNEEIALGAREIYVHYAGGMGRSTLKIPGTRAGTARNLNTLRKLAAMAAEAGQDDSQ